jgi:hypothetical protein
MQSVILAWVIPNLSGNVFHFRIRHFIVQEGLQLQFFQAIKKKRTLYASPNTGQDGANLGDLPRGKITRSWSELVFPWLIRALMAHTKDSSGRKLTRS